MNKVSGIAAAVLLGIGLLAFWLWGPSMRPSKPLPAFVAEQCRLAPDQIMSYAIEVKGKAAFAPAALVAQKSVSSQKFQEVSQQLAGSLSFKDQGRHGGQQQLEAYFQPPEGEATLFELKMSPNCRLSGFRFAAGADLETQRQLVQLLQELQFVLPERKALSKWEAVEQDSVGQYVADYEVEQVQANEVSVAKRKRNYTSLAQAASGPALQAEILESRAVGRFGKDQSWLESYSGEQEIQLSTSQGVFATATQDIHLKRLSQPLPWPKPRVSHMQNERVAYQQQLLGTRVQQKRTRYRPTNIEKNLSGERMGSILLQFSEILNADATGSQKKAVDLLIQYLRDRPEAASSLIQAIRQDILPKRYQSLAFLALELTGTKQAEQALVKVLDDPQFSVMNRMRSALAMQDLQKPSSEVAQALRQQMDQLGRVESDHPEAAVAGTAALALGSLGANVRESNAEQTADIIADLKQQLNRQNDPSGQSVLLEALGNTHDADVVPDIAPFLGDSVESVRSSAAVALGTVGGPEAETLLVESLATEEAAPVKRYIMKSLSKIKDPSPQAVAEVSEQISKESNAYVRAGMIRFLGPLAAQDAEARAALVNMAGQESNESNLRLLGKYLKSEDFN